MSDKVNYLLLDEIAGLGKVGIGKLLRDGLSATDIITQHKDKIERFEEAHAAAVNSVTIAQDLGARLVTWDDDDFPSFLKEIHDPPAYIFCYGHYLSKDQRAVAIVGTRNMTAYGSTVTRKITEALCSRGFTIVSGFMRGIDTIAHKAALDAGGRTIAVLGSGLEEPVPAENERLIPRVATNGMVISEFRPEIAATKFTFPQRNRIVAALSQLVIVVEAGAKSGALITAKLAAEQGKDVATVPGSILALQSAGTNWLATQGAHIITSVEHVLELVGERVKDMSKHIYQPQNELEAAILDLIHDEPLHMDDIVRRLGTDTQQVIATISLLELNGAIEQTLDQKYGLK